MLKSQWSPPIFSMVTSGSLRNLKDANRNLLESSSHDPVTGTVGSSTRNGYGGDFNQLPKERHGSPWDFKYAYLRGLNVPSTGFPKGFFGSQRDSIDILHVRTVDCNCLSLRIATAFDHVRMSSTDDLSISLKLLNNPMNPLK